MKITSIEEDFIQYLKLVYQSPEKIPPEKFIQLKQAFFAAAGQLMMKLKKEVSQLSDEEGMIIMLNLEEEVRDFWYNFLPKN